MHEPVRHALWLSTLVCTLALGQEAAFVRDLDASGRVTLTKDELSQLLPGANMGRLTAKGNTHSWKNDAGGSFVISSDNKDRGGNASTAHGKWNISDDGRYCVLIEWKTVDTEEWCRYIVRAGETYYATKSDKLGTEKVYKLSIKR
ncbi:DUF995 domain-containing protein [Methylibium sp.]|uniref:DUF995 domain-containing protein n=1 Tax=Methylibium sp. TaxID=2067992 RepID=UPI003D0E8CA4